MANAQNVLRQRKRKLCLAGPKQMARVVSANVGENKIFNQVNEIEQLKEELRLKSSELERLAMAKFSSPTSPDRVEPSYHLAFMFASPLIRKVNNNLEAIMQLDYQNEIAGIEKVLKSSKHEIKYKVKVATTNNLRSVIADAPFALHFTGHGIENDKKSLGSVYELYKNKGNILLLEDENCMADYLFESDLKRLVQISNAKKAFSYNYEVVFVSSCHSEFAGRIFLASGARHVICIRKSETISDRASLRFSKVFYEMVFMKKYSVCRAFELAKEDVRTIFTSNEAEKYLLFVNDEMDKHNQGMEKKHKCFPIAKSKRGKLTLEDTPPLFNTVPSTEEIIKGRQQEL